MEFKIYPFSQFELISNQFLSMRLFLLFYPLISMVVPFFFIFFIVIIIFSEIATFELTALTFVENHQVEILLEHLIFKKCSYKKSTIDSISYFVAIKGTRYTIFSDLESHIDFVLDNPVPNSMPFCIELMKYLLI